MSKISFLNFGKATNSNPHNVTNAAVAGMPYSAHVGNVDHEVQDIVDRAQQHEFQIPGEPIQKISNLIPYGHMSVPHIWRNNRLIETLTEHVPIPWLEHP